MMSLSDSRYFRRSLRLLSALLFAIALSSGASAQFDDNGGGSTNPGGGNPGGAYYVYGTGEGYRIDVNVWGFVNNPGKYNVPSKTNLMQIISFAGGPTDRARLEDIRIVHDKTIDSSIVEAIEIYNIDEYVRTGDTLLNPVLYPNDTVIVPGDALNVFREVLGIVRDVALVLGTLIALFIAVSPGSSN